MLGLGRGRVGAQALKMGGSEDSPCSGGRRPRACSCRSDAAWPAPVSAPLLAGSHLQSLCPARPVPCRLAQMQTARGSLPPGLQFQPPLGCRPLGGESVHAGAHGSATDARSGPGGHSLPSPSPRRKALHGSTRHRGFSSPDHPISFPGPSACQSPRRGGHPSPANTLRIGLLHAHLHVHPVQSSLSPKLTPNLPVLGSPVQLPEAPHQPLALLWFG